jgi:hypothetical protein
MFYARPTRQTEPLPAFVAYVNVGPIKHVARLFKSAINRFIFGRNTHVAWLVLVIFPVTSGATEIIVKIVGGVIYVAADSKASLQNPDGTIVRSWGTCKIDDLGGGGVFFGYAGKRGRPFYDIKAVARRAKSSNVIETAAQFERSITGQMDSYYRKFRDDGHSSEQWGYNEVLFYGFENLRPVCIKKTFAYYNDSRNVNVETRSCPPICEPFISAGDGGRFAAQHEASILNFFKFYSGTPKELVRCLVISAIPMFPDHAVGGSVTIAVIGPDGLKSISGGACPDGPQETKTEQPLAADPPQCRVGEPKRNGRK